MEKRKTTLHDLLGLVHRYDARDGDIQPKLKATARRNRRVPAADDPLRFELKSKMSREEWAKVFPQ